MIIDKGTEMKKRVSKSEKDSSSSPLETVHKALGAKMTTFGGWNMPLSYPKGTLSEHQACRNNTALFDISHLGTLEIMGNEALEILQKTLSNDLERIAPGKAQYTHLLDEKDASVVDDMIIWWLNDKHFWVLPNASNNRSAMTALMGCKDLRAERALMAIQGPACRQVLKKVIPEVADLKRFEVCKFLWKKTDGIAAGTGYTGEDGVEIAVPTQIACELWTSLIDAGPEPAGLGARDILRLEAGLPLHGQEFTPGITPLDVNMKWVIGWEKPVFRGRDALKNAQNDRSQIVLRGLVLQGRRPPRTGQTIIFEGEVVSKVTSGNFSPELGKGIAMTFLPTSIPLGSQLTVNQRGKPAESTVVQLPFI